VNNALKHSEAKAITLALRETELAIELEIKDDGKGLNQQSRLGPGMGLHIMDYRARSIGATLEIHGHAGTTVFCRLPKAPSAS
jgi:two-component system sensor kinase FixL